MKKGCNWIVVVLLLLIVLTAGACAPKAAPAPTPKPTPTTAVKTSPAPAHAEITLILQTGSFGGVTYQVGQAIHEIIRKTNHPWLSTVNTEGLGGLDSIITLGKLSKNQKAMTFFTSNNDVVAAAKDAVRDFAGSTVKYTDIRGLMTTGKLQTFFVTLDPKIKTIADLAGKRIAGRSRSSGMAVLLEHILRAEGLLDKVKMQYLATAASSDALRDGLADVLFAYSQKGKPSASYQELFTTKGDALYFIGVPKSTLAKVTQAVGWPFVYEEMPPLTIGRNQTEALGYEVQFGDWWCYADAEDVVVYEFIKMIVENADKFPQYLSPINVPIVAEMSRMVIGVPGQPVAIPMHPGAAKYYREAGMKIGYFD